MRGANGVPAGDGLEVVFQIAISQLQTEQGRAGREGRRVVRGK